VYEFRNMIYSPLDSIRPALCTSVLSNSMSDMDAIVSKSYSSRKRDSMALLTTLVEICEYFDEVSHLLRDDQARALGDLIQRNDCSEVLGGIHYYHRDQSTGCIVNINHPPDMNLLRNEVYEHVQAGFGPNGFKFDEFERGVVSFSRTMSITRHFEIFYDCSIHGYKHFLQIRINGTRVDNDDEYESNTPMTHGVSRFAIFR
jgi:hypothetical protein